MRTAALVLTLLLLLTAASALEPPGEDLSEAISVEELTGHVRYLASDELMGRRTGTEGERLAAEYIAACFRAAGLEPAGDDGSYFRKFALSARKPVPAECLLTVVLAEGEPQSFAVIDDWSPFAFAPDGKVEAAEVVFAGYGLSAPKLGYDDYAGIDVTGKVVVIMRRGPGGAKTRFKGAARRHLSFTTKIIVAEQRGAVGVILVDDRHHFPQEADQCPTGISRAPQQPKIPFVFARRRVAAPLFKAAGEDLEHLAAAIEQAGPQSRPLSGVRVDIVVKTEPQTGMNVIGRIPGTDPELGTEAIVIGAHYDHLGTDGMGGLDPQAKHRLWNGADDNASGTSGVIELAEHFALAQRKPKRTLIFIAFAGEELGLLGSRAYVKSPAVPLKDTIAMVNMDMIGRSKDGRLSVGGTGTCEPFDAIVTRAIGNSGLTVRKNPSGFAPSDNLSFNQVKIPTLFLFTGMHPDYHRTTDDWDKLNYADQQRVVDFAAEVLAGIDALPERPAFVNIPRPRSRGPQLGITLGQGAEGPGVLVGSVMQATPAARAGMLPGDRIIKFAGKKVTGPNDLVAAIRSQKPGTEVEIVVLRDGREVALKVEFAGR